VFENRVIRRIYGRKTGEMTGREGNHKMVGSKIYTLHEIITARSLMTRFIYFFENQMKENETDGTCNTNGGVINAYNILVGYYLEHLGVYG
jgi:hypothetical protein